MEDWDDYSDDDGAYQDWVNEYAYCILDQVCGVPKLSWVHTQPHTPYRGLTYGIKPWEFEEGEALDAALAEADGWYAEQDSEGEEDDEEEQEDEQEQPPPVPTQPEPPARGRMGSRMGV